MTGIDELNQWLQNPEGLNLEFKEANNQFSRDKDLPDYCAALANEGGGKLILGVNNKGNVVGTKAFVGTYHTLSHLLLTKIGIRVDVEEFIHPSGRVLIFHVPPRLRGVVIQSTGNYRYPMRAGESLTEMDGQTLKKILTENEPDHSCAVVKGLAVADLDEEALANFRKRWAEKSGREEYLSFSSEKMLNSIGLLSDEGLNYAALILFGKKEKLDRILPGSEIVYEWRITSGKTAHDFRVNWREPFFKIYDSIREAINAKNIRIPFQDGLFQREILAFSEKTVREALLNAVAHRDYTIQNQSIFIKASPEEFVIESPGGLPEGITIENILYKKAWRNRCIAETFEKAGLVERSGQGMDDIFGNTIREGKGLPDLSRSDSSTVVLKVPAQVKDEKFVLFLEKVANEKQISFSFEEIFELEQIRGNRESLNPQFRKKFIDLGIIEQIGRTSGAKYILSHKYYAFEGKIGQHTKLAGISREKYKELIIKHLKKNGKGLLEEFQDAFPELKPMDISNLLQELKRAKIIEFVGHAKKGYWQIRK